MPYDQGPGDLNVKGAIKIVTHVWGADYGNVSANSAATVYVGNGSDVTQFRDPRKDDEREKRGKKIVNVTGIPIT